MAQVKIQFRPFFKKKSVSIPVSIATAGVEQILKKPIVLVKEVVECFNMCKAAMERRGLKVKKRKDEDPRLKNEIL